MIKILTACTEELDDLEAAASEILNKLCLDDQLCKSTVGILSCHQEFIKTGACKAICQKLPFDTVGITSIFSSVPEGYDQLQFSITVLTSDDVCFSTGLSDPLEENSDIEAILSRLYHERKASLSSDPVMMMPYCTPSLFLDGDCILDILNNISGQLPVFGAFPSDGSTPLLEPMQIIYNGEPWSNRMAMILLSGNYTPSFIVSPVSGRKVFKQKSIVTKCSRNLLQRVNDISAVEYMQSLGLVQNGKLSDASSIPFMIDIPESEYPLVRNTLDANPDGSVVCSGRIPQGSMLSIGSIDYEEVLQTSRSAIEKAIFHRSSGLLMFSSAGRCYALELDFEAEILIMRETIQNMIPYLFAYTGGQFCPVPNRDGKMVNRFHNGTLIICIL